MITYTSATKKIAEEAFQAALLGRSGQSKAAGRPYLPFGTCDEKGNSLLHYAVRSKNLELVRFLTEAGGLDLTWANADLVTPFDLAHIHLRKRTFLHINNRHWIKITFSTAASFSIMFFYIFHFAFLPIWKV